MNIAQAQLSQIGVALKLILKTFRVGSPQTLHFIIVIIFLRHPL